MYGCGDPKGARRQRVDVVRSAAVNHRVEVTAGVLEDETAAQLREFFAHGGEKEPSSVTSYQFCRPAPGEVVEWLKAPASKADGR